MPANNYYTRVHDFQPGARARSGEVDAELNAVELGFSYLPDVVTSLALGTPTFASEARGATVNDYVATMPDTRVANAQGDEVVFEASHTNTGAATLQVDANAARAIIRFDGSALSGGEIVSGLIYALRYDASGTRFQLMAMDPQLAADVTQVQGTSTDDPTSPGIFNANLPFRNANSDAVGSLGFGGGIDMALRNAVHGGSLIFSGENTAGTVITMATMDPDVGISFGVGLSGVGVTGGDKGADSLNFSSIYVSNVAVSQAGHIHSTDDLTSGILGTARGGTGAASFAVDRAVETDGSGLLSASTITATELSYLNNASSEIQAQINGKAATAHNHAAGDITSGILAVARGGTGTAAFTINRAIESDGAGALSASAVTATEMSYLDGVTSAIQTQFTNLDAAKEDVDADILRADTVGVMSAAKGFAIATLTDQATVTWDGDTEQNAQLTLGASRTLANMTNLRNGFGYTLIVVSGGYNITFSSGYRFPGNVHPTLSGTTILSFVAQGGVLHGTALLNSS